MRLHFFSIVILLVLTLSFLANKNFPNGLFSLKELGLYATAVLSSCFVVLIIVLNKHKQIWSFSLLDLGAFIILVIFPFYQYLTQHVKISSLISSIAVYTIFSSLSFLGSFFDWKKTGSKFLIIVVLMLILQLQLCMLQYIGIIFSYHHVSKVSGMFFNPGPFSLYFISLLLTVIPFFLFCKRNKFIMSGTVLVAILSLCILVIIELQSRTAWISLSVALFAIFCMYFIKFKEVIVYRVKKLMHFVLFSLILMLPFAAYLFYNIRPESVNGRILIWQSTTEMISENLWAGIGLGNFVWEYPKYQANQLKYNIIDNKYRIFAGETEYAFNDILQIFCELGLFGGLLYVFIIFYSIFIVSCFLLKKGNSNSRFIVGSGLLAGLITIFVGGMTSYPNQMLPINIWFWTIIAMINLISEHSKISFSFNNKVVILLFGTIAIFFGCFAFQKLRGYVLLSKIRKGTVSYSEVVPYVWYMDNDGEFLNNVGSHFFKNEEYDISEYYFKKAVTCKFDKEFYYDIGNSLEKQNKYTEAFKIYKMIEDAIPYLLKPKFLQAKLYFSLGNDAEFEEKATEVLHSIPKVYNSHNEIMKREMRFLLKKKQNSSN